MQPAPELKLEQEVDDGQFRLDVIVPSWMLSIAAHVVMFSVMAVILRGCQSSGSVGPKAGDGTFREVGLHIKREASPNNSNQDSAAAAPNEAMTRDEGKPQPETSLVGDDNAVSELLSRPSQSGLPLLGPGPAASLRTPSSATDLIKPSGKRGGGDESSGLGETSFFDIAAQGNRFVYVVDRSGSMYDHNAIRGAKEELVASLAALEQTQQFQIIFYNTELIEMRGRDDKAQMQWATEINRTLARQFISGIQPDGGTDHTPPLRKALRYQPEHLFFLTDADQPQLSARELNEIRIANGGRTKIHCVEFGKGTEINADNFLKRLARENGGTYRYRDVTRFDRRQK